MTTSSSPTPDGGAAATLTFDYQLGAGLLSDTTDRLVLERAIERAIAIWRYGLRRAGRNEPEAMRGWPGPMVAQPT